MRLSNRLRVLQSTSSDRLDMYIAHSTNMLLNCLEAISQSTLPKLQRKNTHESCQRCWSPLVNLQCHQTPLCVKLPSQCTPCRPAGAWTRVPDMCRRSIHLLGWWLRIAPVQNPYHLVTVPCWWHADCASLTGTPVGMAKQSFQRLWMIQIQLTVWQCAERDRAVVSE